MNTVNLCNISLDSFRDFLIDQGCTKIKKGTSRGRGGHEKWVRKGLLRPITLQTHVDPVPEHIVRSSLRTLNVSRKEFENWYLSK